MFNEFKIDSAYDYEGDLVGREIVVAPEHQKEFSDLFKNRFHPEGWYRVCKVTRYGLQVYVSFVESPREEDIDYRAPYHGTTDAKFFHVMP